MSKHAHADQASPRTIAASAAVSSYFFELHAETFRLAGYFSFWTMIVVGIIITRATKSEYEINNSPLVNTFGYNNVCVYIDYEAARSVGALLWIFAEYLLVIYCLLNTMAFHFLYKQRQATQSSTSLSSAQNKPIKPWHMAIVWFMFPFQVILIPTFRMIYVDSPFDQGMGAHYAPFAGLQWALVFICLQNYFYHVVDARINLPNWLGLSYLLLLVGLTFLKQAFTLGAINNHPIWCSVGPDCSAGGRAAQGIDIIWMVLAAVTPAILAYYARRNTPFIRFTVTMGDDRFAGHAVKKQVVGTNGQHVEEAQLVNMKSVPQLTIPSGGYTSSPASPDAPQGSAASPVVPMELRYGDHDEVATVSFNTGQHAV